MFAEVLITSAGLTCAAARAGVDGFVPLVGAGHGEGALVHSVFTAAKHQTARLQRRAAVGVRRAWKIKTQIFKSTAPSFLVNSFFFWCVLQFKLLPSYFFLHLSISDTQTHTQTAPRSSASASN